MIRAENIVKTYGSGESKNAVLKGVNLQLTDGETVVILGPSGSGKSTLLNVLSGLERPDGGTVLYGDTDVYAQTDRQLTAFRRKYIGLIFQQYYLLPEMTVDKNVRMGADLAGNGSYRDIIEAVGLKDKVNKYPSQLSGGEQQRVCIARALAKNPQALFLDEPTGALDETTGRQVLDYILKIKAQKRFTAVMVTHNVNFAGIADTVVYMNSGNIVRVERNACVADAYSIGW